MTQHTCGTRPDGIPPADCPDPRAHRHYAHVLCRYSLAHKLAGIAATVIIDCGPAAGKIPACQPCADLYQRLGR